LSKTVKAKKVTTFFAFGFFDQKNIIFTYAKKWLMCCILRVSRIFYAKKWRMLILVKICLGGGSLNSTFCQIYSPVFRKNIFANLDSQN